MADTGLITSIDAGRSGTAFRSTRRVENLPETAVDELEGTLVDLGIVAESGVTHATNRETDDRKGLGGDVVYTLQTSVDNTIVLTLMESQNAEVLRTVVGDDNVLVDSATGHVTVRHNKAKMPRCTFVFDFLIDQGLKRSLVEVGQVITVGDVVNTSTEIIQYEVTIKCFAGPRIDGDFMRDFYAYTDGAIALGVATGMLPDATEGTEYGYQLRASGGTAPYSWTAVGELPTGLTLSTTGHLSGTPTVSGEQQVTVNVSDENGITARKTLPLHIKAATAESESDS